MKTTSFPSLAVMPAATVSLPRILPMSNPPPSSARSVGNSPQAIQRLRWTLLFLILELVFEGLARKLNIAGTNIAIFLLKDVIVAAIGIQVALLKRPQEIDFLWLAYLAECVLFFPLILATATHDPLLAIFGAKEYLLYPAVGFGTYLAFETAPLPDIIRFFRWLALLVIPTALVALLQLHLPPGHWLNQSVDGESLDAFSAGGHLRVSSTFPFVAQYCAFITAEVFILMLALNSLKDVKWPWKAFFLMTIPLLIISSYVTGSRGAVLGCGFTVLSGAVLAMIKYPGKNVVRMTVIIGGLLLTLSVSRFLFPDAFAGYSEREQGQLIGASSEIQTRIYSSMFDWMKDIFTTPFFGNGIGIMSNGSEMLSHYALVTRAFSWTETDFATTLFEGGLYLIIIWYLFRYFVIFQVVRHFFKMKQGDLTLPNSFCVGFAMVTGVEGTLAIQPPIAIWWWLSVGTSLLLWRKSWDAADGVTPHAHSGEAPPLKLVRVRGRSAYAERLHSQSK